jgi:hypothetical protein
LTDQKEKEASITFSAASKFQWDKSSPISSQIRSPYAACEIKPPMRLSFGVRLRSNFKATHLVPLYHLDEVTLELRQRL